MPSKSVDSKCLTEEKLSATRMGRSSRLLLFRKAKTKLSLEEFNLTVDGLVAESVL
jgi:hypothetical protein